jgi:hypothetical protein
VSLDRNIRSGSVPADCGSARSETSSTLTDRPVASFDGGRPWVRSVRPVHKSGESAGLAGISSSLAITTSGSGASSGGGVGSGSVEPFAKLVDDINGALSVREVGPVTIDGQQTSGFVVSSSLERILSPGQLASLAKAFGALGTLLSPIESPKQRAEAEKHREEAARHLGQTPVILELFIAPSGLPVRTISIIGSRSSGIGVEEDILALEVPVHVHVPPAPDDRPGTAAGYGTEALPAAPMHGVPRSHPRSRVYEVGELPHLDGAYRLVMILRRRRDDRCREPS